MSIRVILFGASGMIGQGVLRECLSDPEVETILLVNRQSIALLHPKVREILHPDFSDFSDLENEFSEYDTCFFCLGVSSVGLAEEAYQKITYDITIRAAEVIRSTGKSFTFCYVSGAGTDSSEKGKSMWARVKGKTENKLLSMGFRQAFMFRPGFIQPLNGIRSKTKMYKFFYTLFMPFYFLLRQFSGLVTDTRAMGKAMINVALNGYSSKILRPADINKLAAMQREGK